MQKLEMLQILSEKVSQCTKCKELAETRTQTVFGEGNPNADICFCGEACGKDEDLQGRPFVGKAGKLLNKIIEAMGLKREEVYICNILKCRPPNNRKPFPEEADNCSGFLKLQLEIVNPKIIVCLGSTATHNLLKINTPISQIRGIWHEYNGTPVMPTFHPSYLLRSPSAKELVWEDMKEVLNRI